MSQKKKKQVPPANAEIIREQIQLVKTEKELKSALENVNEQINKLLVEELQLKSILARSHSNQSQIAVPKVEPINAVHQFDSVNVINEQKLNLFPGKCNQSIEEYDDE